MNTATAVAQHLNIAEAAIAKVEEWAHVLFVRFVSGRPRFVTKKVMKTNKNIEIKKVDGGFQSFFICPRVNPWTKKEYMQTTQTSFGFKVWETEQEAIDAAQSAYDKWLAAQEPKRDIDEAERDRLFVIGMGMHQTSSGEWIDEDEYEHLQEMGIDP